MASGSRRAHTYTTDFQEKSVATVNPTARHQATIVWLHDRNEFGAEAAEFVRSFSLYNVKWICPNSPGIKNMGFGGVPGGAWFKVNNILRSDSEELEGLKEAAAFVFGLLKDEPENVMKGVAGYRIGGALALHIAGCYALGTFPIQIQAVVGINCWLPNRIKLSDTIKSSPDARSRAAELPVLVTHGYDDNMIFYTNGESAADDLDRAGFQVKLKLFHHCDHAIAFQIMTEVSLWLTRKFELEGEPDTTV